MTATERNKRDRRMVAMRLRGDSPKAIGRRFGIRREQVWRRIRPILDALARTAPQSRAA